MRHGLLALVCAAGLSAPLVVDADGGPMSGRGGFGGGRPVPSAHMWPGPSAGLAQRWPGAVQTQPWPSTHIWTGHTGWPQGGGHFNQTWWRTGHWWHGMRGRRFGWWWAAGPVWFWYPALAYPYPDLYTPPPYPPLGYQYWCDFYLNYFPNVPDCPTGWEAIPAQ